ncbi:MAG: hypothetical protein OXK74_11015 [Gemmatimonadota bacterium]|nr:hypothetical protein [Gemmatimonadota bacterium]
MLAGSVFRLAAVVAVVCAIGCGEKPTPPQLNRHPYVTEPFPPTTVFVGDTLTEVVSDNFTDPDGDELTYAASSTDSAVVDVTITGATLRMITKGKRRATVRAVATDDGGLSGVLNIRLTVGNRRPMIAESLPGSEWYIGEGAAYLLGDYFEDPDRDLLRYEAASSDGSVVSVHLAGDTLRLEALEWGDAEVAVTATDPQGLSVEQVIAAAVVPIPKRLVLQFLYDMTGGAEWKRNDNWGTGADLATWYGVEVDEEGRIKSLSLGDNNLNGAIPPQLGELPALERLDLESNELEGEIPVYLSRLSLLAELRLTNNRGLGGELPADFPANVTRMKVLLAGGTDVCAPNNAGFRGWLDGVGRRWVKMCERKPPEAYLVQAVQSRGRTVPLVGGKQALLRVFATSSHSTLEEIPPVRATFYLEDAEVHSVTIPGQTTPIPVVVGEGSLRKSANAQVPAGVVEPGLEMVVEIDPDGTLDEELGVAARIPEEGRVEVDVRTMPTLDLTVIPFLWETDPDSAILDITRKMADEEEEHGRLQATYDILPTGDFEVSRHDPVESSSNNAFSLLSQTNVIRREEGTDGYFQGQMSGRVTGASGVAYLSHKSSFSIPNNRVIAHELGHNQSLRHAPCGGAAGPDPNFPQDNGKIGNWGYDFRRERLMDPGRFYDMMSYCGPWWISGFFFAKALRYRLQSEYAAWRGSSASVRTILVWGGLDEHGRPFLNPAFVMEAPPGMPAFSGAYALTGRNHEGAVLFSVSFDMPEVAHGEGESSSFAFTLPVQAGWADALAGITLAGPGGSVTLDRDTDEAMTIARAGRGGPIRAFWSGWRDPSADRPEWVLLRSRGIPDREEWER